MNHEGHEEHEEETRKIQGRQEAKETGNVDNEHLIVESPQVAMRECYVLRFRILRVLSALRGYMLFDPRLSAYLLG